MRYFSSLVCSLLGIASNSWLVGSSMLLGGPMRALLHDSWATSLQFNKGSDWLGVVVIIAWPCNDTVAVQS
jgi:hypothetical protein